MKILDIYKKPLYTLYQWDVNQYVNIVGINPDKPVSVQFWRAGQSEAFVVESTVSGNTVTAAIPNELLREPGELVIYIWQDTGAGEQKGGRTETFFNVPIKERAQPSDYIYDDNVEYISVKTVIEDAKTATTAAQEATEAATSAAKLANDTANDIKQRADSGEFDGAQGEPGQSGADGKSATITIGTVTTVSPDTPASVTNTGTETDAVFNFEIPKGADGSGGDADLDTIEKIAIKTTIEGNPAMSGSSTDWRIPLIEGYGKSTQGADPTPEAPQEVKSPVVTGIKVTGKNLFDEQFCKVDENWIGGPGGYNYIPIFVGKGNTVTFSTSGNPQQGLGFCCALSKYKKELSSKVYSWIYHSTATSLIKTEGTFVVTESDYIYFSLNNVAGNINKFLSAYPDFQIEISPQKTYYMPYQGQSIQLSTPITLRGIPSDSGNVTINGQKYLSDYIGQKDGMYGVFRHIESLINLDFDKDWKIYEVPPYYGFYLENVLNAPSTRKRGICNQGSLVDINSTGEGKNKIIVGAGNKAVYFLGTSFYNAESSDKGLQDWKKHLKENPLQIDVFLDYKTFEPLPPEDVQALADLKTFYPSSIISWETEDGAGAWTRAEIVHDPTNYIDEKISNAVTQAITLAQGGTI